MTLRDFAVDLTKGLQDPTENLSSSISNFALNSVITGCTHARIYATHKYATHKYATHKFAESLDTFIAKPHGGTSVIVVPSSMYASTASLCSNHE